MKQRTLIQKIMRRKNDWFNKKNFESETKGRSANERFLNNTMFNFQEKKSGSKTNV
jgi:hypothetical protein